MPGASRAERPLVVLARSARALAQAARAAGYAPRVIDLFGDADTRDCAARYRRCRAQYGYDFDPDAAIAAIIGTPPTALPAVISPRVRARRLRRLGIATPDLASARVPTRGAWLVKRSGEAGGWHVRAGVPGEALGGGHYAQRLVQGRSLSVSFVAGAQRVQIIGYAAQLFAARAESPYAWAGAVGGIAPPPRVQRSIAAALPSLVAAFALRGLCGFDFVLDGDGRWWLVDLNPRPTATLELLAPPAAALRAHLAACRGRDWRDIVPRARPWALTVPWLTRPIRLPKSLDWPAWVADRPGAGARLPRGAPLCSVRAAGKTAEGALRALHRRLRALGDLLGSDAWSLPDWRPPRQR